MVQLFERGLAAVEPVSVEKVLDVPLWMIRMGLRRWAGSSIIEAAILTYS